jgi:uncharacterized protein (DUF983 family)
MEHFFWALTGRCPNCGRASIYHGFLKPRPTCPSCHVRFERWNGSWTIPTVMGYTSGALFAIVLGIWFLHNDRLEGSENIIIPATVVFTALFYPVCKNVSFFLLWRNGFIFVDPPAAVPDDPDTKP